MNFALILFCLLLVSGAIWMADVFIFSKRRAAQAKDPWWVEYGASFFPVILLVFVLRSFLVEPFKIPSGSMIPTLEVGDFILVNKFAYGIRLPVINKKIIDIGEPQRGDAHQAFVGDAQGVGALGYLLGEFALAGAGAAQAQPDQGAQRAQGCQG